MHKQNYAFAVWHESESGSQQTKSKRIAGIKNHFIKHDILYNFVDTRIVKGWMYLYCWTWRGMTVIIIKYCISHVYYDR